MIPCIAPVSRNSLGYIAEKVPGLPKSY